MRRALTLLATASLLGGCVVGPNYVKPSTPAPGQPGGGTFAASAPDSDSDAPLPPNWWRLYDDPVLNGLVEDALAHNKTLLQSAANLVQARAALSLARASRYPATTLSAGAQYGVSSDSIFAANLIQDARGAPNGGGVTVGSNPNVSVSPQSYYSYGLDVSYEVDLFGRITRTIQAARADAQAQAAALDVTRVSVAGETTRAYVNACAFGEELADARVALAAIQQTFDITKQQRDAGAVSDYEVTQQQALLDQTRASVPTYEAERRSALYQLAVLTGRPPEAVSRDADACTAPPKLKEAVPVGDGRALIRRRPDVRQAERQLAGNVARIGVATADLYPTITLGGSAMEEATKLGNLASVGGLSYLVGPLLSWSFPNTLVAQANVREARAVASASLAGFQATVLQALQDVETSLATYQGELRRNKSLGDAAHQDRIAYDLAQVRYRNGSISYLNLLTAETTLVQADLTLADSNQALGSDQVTLFKALGGGWEQAPGVAPLPIPNAKKGGAAKAVT